MTESLVTGGAGLIGSHVARQCLALGHEVVVLDDLSGSFRNHVPDGCALVQGNVTDHDGRLGAQGLRTRQSGIRYSRSG